MPLYIGAHFYSSDVMMLSPYAVFFEREKKHYVFSTLTKALLELDKEMYARLSQATEHNSLYDSIIDESDKELLYDSHIICDNQQDEFVLCKSMILDNRNDETDMHLTITPTMDCCFSCYYCFEREKEPAYMTLETVDSIIKLVEGQKNLKSLHVTWFGGEPLMATHIIQYFTYKLLKNFKGSYSADIITTAFHINEKVIDILKKTRITEMQISIDGKERTHNSVKYTSCCDNSFLRTINNIELLNKLYPTLTIGVRVNLSKQNYDEYKELYCDLSNRFKGKRVSIFPGYIVSRNDVELDNLFTHNEVSSFSLNLWESYRIPTPWILYSCKQGECAIRKSNSLVIDASANVYKCWEKVGNKRFIVGKLAQNGDIVDADNTLLRRYIYSADPLEDEKCRVCKMLPICFGGCPIQRIENLFENKKNILCTTYKDKLEQWLSAYIDFKEFLNSYI